MARAHRARLQTAGARSVAAAMFGRPVGGLTAEDLGDAVGELANVLGGNVKSLLPAPTGLSLPHVAATADPQGRSWPGTAEVCRTVVSWRGEPFVVTVLRNEIDLAPRPGPSEIRPRSCS